MSLGPLEILSHQTHFHTKWVGDLTLNQKGLHRQRIRTSDWCLKTRQHFFSTFERLDEFNQQGMLQIENFLSEEKFTALQLEGRKTAEETELNHPFAKNASTGFGQKIHFKGGFDRYDGATLNRFIAISPQKTPESLRFIKHPELRKIIARASGSFGAKSKFSIYQTIHGNESENEDIQKAWHRDSFQSAIKCWFFLEDVNPEQGPFEYVKGSHRMTEKRMQWEHEQAVKASTPGKNTGGSFRISDQEINEWGFGEPINCSLKANTLLLADIRGFHRRGQAVNGARRLAIYGNFRPYPFSPIPLG